MVFQDFILPALSLGNVISGQNAFEEKVVIEILEKLGIKYIVIFQRTEWKYQVEKDRK